MSIFWSRDRCLSFENICQEWHWSVYIVKWISRPLKDSKKRRFLCNVMSWLNKVRKGILGIKVPTNSQGYNFIDLGVS